MALGEILRNRRAEASFGASRRTDDQNSGADIAPKLGAGHGSKPEAPVTKTRLMLDQRQATGARRSISLLIRLCEAKPNQTKQPQLGELGLFHGEEVTMKEDAASYFRMNNR